MSTLFSWSYPGSPLTLEEFKKLKKENKMNVRTQADECMDKAVDNIEQTINELSNIITGKVWGYNEYNDTYKRKIRDSFMDLVAMRDKLQ